MSLVCNSFNANKQEQDTKNRSFSRLLAEGLNVGAMRPHLCPKHYDGDIEAQAKPSTIGAKYRIGFTLAEVLTTLSIIGVVAALTIPSLVFKNQEKETIVQLKKTYNVISNAFSLATLEYGDPSNWNLIAQGSDQGGNNALNKFAPYLNIIQKCGDKPGCFPKNVTYHYYNNTIMGNVHDKTTLAKAVLADGSMFFIYIDSPNCSNDWGSGILEKVCASITFDVNGAKGPNTMGKDVFGFYITQSGIAPRGLAQDTVAPLKTQCKTGLGVGCTAWALLQENLDYPDDWVNESR